MYQRNKYCNDGLRMMRATDEQWMILFSKSKKCRLDEVLIT